VPDFLIDKVMDQDPQVADLKKAIMSTKAALDDAISKAKNPAHDPTVKSYQAQYQSFQKQLEDLRTEMRPKIEAQYKQMGTGQNPKDTFDLDELTGQRDSLQKSLDPILKDYDQVAAELAGLQRSNAALKGLEQELRELEISRAELQRRLNAIDIELKLP